MKPIYRRLTWPGIAIASVVASLILVQENHKLQSALNESQSSLERVKSELKEVQALAFRTFNEKMESEQAERKAKMEAALARMAANRNNADSLELQRQQVELQQQQVLILDSLDSATYLK